MPFDAQTRIGDVVLEKPAAMRVFEAMNMDYCCGGHRPLGEAAALAGQPLEEVLHRLGDLEAPKPSLGDPRDWAEAPMTALIAHIVATHHAFTRSELDRVTPLMARVLRVHGENHPELARLDDAFRRVCEDIRPHLEREEAVLFPAIRALEAGEGPSPQAFVLRELQEDHEALGVLLQEIRSLTGGHTPPPDACGSFRSLYMGLQSLEADLHLHIYLENHLLFPRAASRLREGAQS